MSKIIIDGFETPIVTQSSDCNTAISHFPRDTPLTEDVTGSKVRQELLCCTEVIFRLRTGQKPASNFGFASVQNFTPMNFNPAVAC